jgi:hypothetical protein
MLTAVDYFDPELLIRTTYLESSDIHLEFEVVGTTLESLVETARVWLTKTDDNSMSMVGLLSSNRFSDLAESFLGKSFVTDLRMFLYANSLAHVRQIPDTEDLDHSTYEIRVNAAYRGRKILNHLDWILSPQSQGRASRDELRATFLGVLLTTLGVGYSAPLRDSSGLFEPMREQLCDMLSAHLILIGSRLDIRFHPDIQRKLFTSAVNHWGKEAYFTWSKRITTELPVYSTHRPLLLPYPEENIFRKLGSDFSVCNFCSSNNATPIKTYAMGETIDRKSMHYLNMLAPVETELFVSGDCIGCRPRGDSETKAPDISSVHILRQGLVSRQISLGTGCSRVV